MAARRGEGQKGRASRGQSPKPPARGSPLLDVSPLPPQTSSERRPGAAAEAAPTLHRRPPPPPARPFPADRGGQTRRRPRLPPPRLVGPPPARRRRGWSRARPPLPAALLARASGGARQRRRAGGRRRCRRCRRRCGPTPDARHSPTLHATPGVTLVPCVRRGTGGGAGQDPACAYRRWVAGRRAGVGGGSSSMGRLERREEKKQESSGCVVRATALAGCLLGGGTARAERRSAGSGAPASLTMLPHTSRCYRYRGAGWTPPCRGPPRTRRAPPPLPTPASHCPKAGRPASAAAPSAAQCAAAARHTRAETRPHGRHAGPKPGLPTWCGGLVTDAQVPTRVPHRRAPRGRHGPPLAALDSRAAPPRLCVAGRVQHRIALARDGRRDWSHPRCRPPPSSPSPLAVAHLVGVISLGRSRNWRALPRSVGSRAPRLRDVGGVDATHPSLPTASHSRLPT